MVANVVNISLNLDLYAGEATPRIVTIEPAKLGDPGSFIHLAKTFISHRNHLKCAAENADDIYWMYMPDTDHELTRSLPSEMTELPVKQEEGLLVAELTDEGVEENARRNINGYYQCMATNERTNYVAISPPIRLIYPGQYSTTALLLMSSHKTLTLTGLNR